MRKPCLWVAIAVSCLLGLAPACKQDETGGTGGGATTTSATTTTTASGSGGCQGASVLSYCECDCGGAVVQQNICDVGCSAVEGTACTPAGGAGGTAGAGGAGPIYAACVETGVDDCACGP